MSERLQLVTLRPGTDVARWCEARRPTSSLVAPTLPGGFNAGDVLRRPTTAAGAAVVGDEGVTAAEDVTAVEDISAEPVDEGGAPTGRGVYRAALFAADREPTAGRLAAFEADLVALAHHVGAIARWRLSRVTTSSGTAPWTHVWEQEYVRLDDLTGPYMLHPAHWGLAERWFDPAFPEWLVRPHLCHAFCEIDQPAWPIREDPG